MPRLALLLVAFVVTPLLVVAQSDLPRFEVASVRPNTGTDGIDDIPPTPPEGVVLHNRSLADVVRYAYQLPSFRLIGLPRWAEDERFDIVAKAARPITEAERQAMVRALLADRFRVKAHFEKRDQTIYVMTRAKGDGSLARPRPGELPARVRVADICPNTWYYKSQARDASALRMRIRAIAQARPRFASHPDCQTREIDVAPLQAQSLVNPQSRIEKQDSQRLRAKLPPP